MSVILVARPVLLLATAVWVIWRIVTWRRGRSGDLVREVVVAGLFVWSLVIVRLTFFPLTIIFYDWNGASNLVPFASIYQLLTETSAAVAFENIVGNIVLFAPLGVLLPVLFRRLQGWPQMLWRAAAISALIEATQFVTRARSVDVDDIILNSAGAMIGYVTYRILNRAVRRYSTAQATLDRLAATNRSEPLLCATVPVLLTALIAVPTMVNQVFDATLSRSDVTTEATAGWSDATVAAETNVNDHSYVVVSQSGSEGPLRLATFQRVLPGRYTALGTAEEPAAAGSRFATGISSFNPTAGEQPILVLWGYNDGPAATLSITGNGIAQLFELPANDYFVVGAEFPYDPDIGILPDFRFAFADEAGADVTPRFRASNG